MTHRPGQEEIEQDLKKRQQELRCLYRISLEADSDKPLEQTLRNSAGHLRQGLLHPDASTASITLDGIEYSSGPHPAGDASPHYNSDLVVNRNKRGMVAVYFMDNAKSLKEEEELVREVGGMISRAVERREMQAELERRAGVPEGSGGGRRPQEDGELFEKAPTPLLVARLNGDIVRANRAFYELPRLPGRWLGRAKLRQGQAL